MVETYSELLSPSARGKAMFVWHCVNCGDYMDRLVLLNRWDQHRTPPRKKSLLGNHAGPAGNVKNGLYAAYRRPLNFKKCALLLNDLT